MTANYEFVNKLRDVLVAEQVGKMAALGYFDVEFTLYGCAYYQVKKDMVYYKISSSADELYRYLDIAPRYDIFPSNIECFTLKCPVPLGEKETIELKVKHHLARQLQQSYPKSFFLRLTEIAEQVQNNSAASLLWKLADEIEGHFEENQLKQFEILLHYTYSCRKIRTQEYSKLLAWLQEEYDNMLDSVINQDVYEKTFYGIAYENNGTINYYSNAQFDYVYRKIETLEKVGEFVSPVFVKHYVYNKQTQLREKAQQFKKELRQRYTETYMKELHALRATGYTREDILAMGKENCINAACMETLKRYATHWST